MICRGDVGRSTLAIDVDDVLLEFMPHFVEYCNDRYHATRSLEDFTNYDFEAILGVTRDELIDVIWAYLGSEYALRAKPIAGAVDGLHALHDWYDLVGVTARPDEFSQATETIIEPHFPGLLKTVRYCDYYRYRKNHDIERIELAKPLRKIDVCLEERANIHVDDNSDYAKEFEGHGISFVLFGDYPWNRSVNLPSSVMRVKDWYDLCAVLLDLRPKSHEP